MRFTGNRETASRPKQIARTLLAAAVAFCIFAATAAASASAFGPLSSFGTFGGGAGQLTAPSGLTIGSDGSVYVADYANNRVAVFSASGTFLHAFGREVNALDGSDVCTPASGCRAGAVGDSAAGSIILPEGVEIGPDGLLYASDSGNGRVDVFTPGGAFVRAFGKEVNSQNGSDVCTTECVAGIEDGTTGSMTHPGGVDFDGAGLLYVADQGDNRIDVFTPGGAFVRAFGKEVNAQNGGDICTTSCQRGMASGSGGGMWVPADVEVGPGALLAVSDLKNHRVDVFEPGGGFVRAFGKEVNLTDGGNVCTGMSCAGGTAGHTAGALNEPVGLAVDRGRILVAEVGNNRISEFGFDGSFVRAFGLGVLNGAVGFQVCSLGTGCLAGYPTGGPGSIGEPFGLAVDRAGTIYVSEGEPDPGWIELFGEKAAEPPPPPPPSNRFQFGGLKLNRARGTATLTVTVPDPGAVRLSGVGIALASAEARGAGDAQLAVRPLRTIRRKLVRTGKARVTARVTFTPIGGSPLTMSKALVLRKTLRRR